MTKLNTMSWVSKKSYSIYYFVCFIGFMIVRLNDRLMMFQLAKNPIHSPRQDPFIWLLQWTGIPDAVAHTSIAIGFDIALFLLPVFLLYRAIANKGIYKLALIHFILFFFYVAIIYCYPSLSIRKYLGLLWVALAFTFASEKRYITSLEALRYYVCFIFSSASIWKISRGLLWDTDHMTLTLKAQHIDNVINHQHHFVTKTVLYLIENPELSHLLLLSAIASQLIFILGFFTKKVDSILLFLLLVFILFDFLIMRIEYWEFIVFIPLFLKEEKINSYIDKLSNVKSTKK